MAESQKFIARNRAPRVQIEYDVELYGAEKKVQLPFVMGVMSDLSGKSKVAQPSVDDRKFLEIDVDSFDERMKAMQPRVEFSVPNTLTGEGNLPVDLVFERMEDFSPAAIAAKIAPLKALLDARTELSNLMAYMDGKSGAEALIERILANPALLAAASGAADSADTDAALAGLRASAPVDDMPTDTTDATLAGLAAAMPQDSPREDPLAALRTLSPVEEVAAVDTTADTLAGLSAAAPKETPAEDPLAALNTLTPVAEVETTDSTAKTLAKLAAPVAEDAPAEDAFAALTTLSPVEASEDTDTTANTLLGLAAAAPQELPTADPLAALDSLAPIEETEAEDTTDDTLADLAAAPRADAHGDDTDVPLGRLGPVEDAQVEDTTDDTLTGLAASAPLETTAEDPLAALDSLSFVEEVEDKNSMAGTLASLAASAPTDAPEEDALGALDSVAPMEEDQTENTSADALASLSDMIPETDPKDDPLAALDSLAPVEDMAAEETVVDAAASLAAAPAGTEADNLDDLLGDLSGDADLDDLLEVSQPEPEAAASDDLDDFLGNGNEGDGLDELLGALTADETLPESPVDPAPLHDSDLAAAEDLDALLGGLSNGDGLEDLLNGSEPDPNQEPQANPAVANELDDLLGDLTGDDALDDLLSDPTPEPLLEPDQSDLEDLLGDLTSDDSLDDLLADPGSEPEVEPVLELARPVEPEFAFGTIAGERPAMEKLNRKRFRMAILGDFSGRSARGLVETGDGLATRVPMPLDPDTADELIERFATTLVLPIGKDGAGVEVTLRELDNLHPDELFETLPLFADLVGLKAQLGAGATAESAATKLRQWAEQHGTYAAPTRRTSSGNAMPANRRLSEFQALIGDTSGQLTQPSAIEDLLARVVGPHIRAVPNADAQAMQMAVDQSIAAAMRLILHHPEFQSLEAQWRSIDLIARSIEADDTLDVVLYDVSAEEIAADLARADDLSQSGLARMLTEAPLDEDTGRGGFSAILGLYTFEETPPHAQILGRIARVAAHVDAPFFGAMAAGTMATDKADRHPIVSEAWDGLRDMAEAKYLGLVTPRFMLRRPYGAKTEPTYEFDFEEFTMQDGLSGLLWANPVVLVAILLAQSFRANGRGMNLGSVMGLGGLPYHFVTDRHGDQVQLPCTERNLTEKTVEAVMARGLMPVVSIRGRDEIRLASFQALGGGTVLGPWSDVPPPPPTAPKPKARAETGAADDLAGDLDDLLAGFDDSTPAPADPGDMDAELAALLDGL